MAEKSSDNIELGISTFIPSLTENVVYAFQDHNARVCSSCCGRLGHGACTSSDSARAGAVHSSHINIHGGTIHIESTRAGAKGGKAAVLILDSCAAYSCLSCKWKI